jgi:hypothetical protein
MKTAKQIKVGDQITKQGLKLIVREIRHEEFKNGKKALTLCCSCVGSDLIDSFITHKIDTKVS